jgi:hypothetical protein
LDQVTPQEDAGMSFLWGNVDSSTDGSSSVGSSSHVHHNNCFGVGYAWLGWWHQRMQPRSTWTLASAGVRADCGANAGDFHRLLLVGCSPMHKKLCRSATLWAVQSRASCVTDDVLLGMVNPAGHHSLRHVYHTLAVLADGSGIHHHNVLLIPSLVCVFWMATFGNISLRNHHRGTGGVFPKRRGGLQA